MPEKAVKPANPPTELTDRTEGWGANGRIEGYPAHKDDGTWPATITNNNVAATEASETSEGDWYRNGTLIS